ncbi:MAG: hypothetical protein EOP04_29635 [Proteobacteria bacterium]|nr:MAG: hypothetical protein EOP04_29635 [Pseudomonadota bacterium]
MRNGPKRRSRQKTRIVPVLHAVDIPTPYISNEPPLPKVWIDEGYLPTLIDLILQLRELGLNSGRKLLKSDHKIPYAKMISKYFSHAGKDISIETIRNYFVEKKGDVPVKGTMVPTDRRLFRIVRADGDFGSVV